VMTHRPCSSAQWPIARSARGVDRAGRVGRRAEQQHFSYGSYGPPRAADRDQIARRLVGRHLDGHATASLIDSDRSSSTARAGSPRRPGPQCGETPRYNGLLAAVVTSTWEASTAKRSRARVFAAIAARSSAVRRPGCTCGSAAPQACAAGLDMYPAWEVGSPAAESDDPSACGFSAFAWRRRPACDSEIAAMPRRFDS